MLFGKKKELSAMPKKGVRVWNQQSRAQYNAYSKKELKDGRSPISREKWLKIHGG